MKACKYIVATIAAAALTGCGNGDTTYSLLQDGQTFNQASTTVNSKTDVLWVIDNSGSMATSQANLANNFPSFITKFTDKSFDFQIAVTTTDSYLAQSPLWDSYFAQVPKPSYYEGASMAQKARFRDGVGSSHSGFFVLTPSTPNLNSNFVINATQGINGRGDERSFQSMEAALMSSLNQPFYRSGSTLAVILLTDEDDFSNDSTTAYESYVAQLKPVSYYVSLLEAITGTSGASKKFSVNTIAVPDTNCLNSIYSGAQKIGQRVNQLADATGGIKGNICGNFATELAAIANQIVKLSTKFPLGDKKPVPSTIVVKIDGVARPSNEWFYEASTNSIVFNDGFAPAQGAVINVTFDPESLNF